MFEHINNTMENSLRCPNCLSVVTEDAEVCPNCKAEFYNCSRCNTLVLAKDRICRNCGSILYGKDSDDFFDRIPERIQNVLILLIFIILFFSMTYILRNCAF